MQDKYTVVLSSYLYMVFGYNYGDFFFILQGHTSFQHSNTYLYIQQLMNNNKNDLYNCLVSLKNILQIEEKTFIIS